MRFMVLMYTVPSHTKAMSRAELDAVADKHAALRRELTGSGELLNGAGLTYPEDSTTMRLMADGVLVADGPVVESEEHMTAYYVLDCASEERARSIAAGILDFHVTAVEVRAIHDSVGFP